MHHQLLNEHYPNNIIGAEKGADHFLFRTHNGVLLRVEVITDHVLRFRYSAKGYFAKDFSYALDAQYKSGYSQLELGEEEDFYFLKTPKLEARIAKFDLKIKLFGEEGKLLNEDEKGFHWEENTQQGGNIVKMSKRSLPGEYYYGLGDKPTNLNLRDRRFQNWGTDTYGFAKDADPLYRNIPFYYGLHQNGCYGIYFDNTFRSFFDFASERNNVTSFWAEGGEMNYFFIYGSSLMNIAQRYVRLTGKPELPPLWALGYHQCKWSYASEKEVTRITSKLRELQIPCDAIYLDIDYMDGFRCFTWNKETFPQPKEMVAKLKSEGFKTVAIIDPGIKVDMDYQVCREGFENDYFCTYADGPLYRGKVWPGDCYFPDFTNPEVREWWQGLFQDLISEVGLAGIWNDMNEPAIMDVPSKTFPLEIRHDYDGHPCSHRKAHNVYGMQMSRASFQGVKQFSFPNRPFLITRSTFSGGQRFSSVWTGDNIATWEHLWVANVQCQRLSISGFSFVGTDIGGFTEHPTTELYLRWLQLAVFHPLMRTHSSGDHGEQEPWSFGEEATDLAREAIEMRYRLLPYHYTTFQQYVSEGSPMLRPLVFIDQEDSNTWYRQDEFMFGDNILVCPVLEPNRESRRLYLPKGPWYHYYSGALFEGGKEITVNTPLNQIPVFVKAGAVIPHYPIQQYVGEKQIQRLDLHVYWNEEQNESFLYEDKGDGYTYKQDFYASKRFTLMGNGKKTRLTQSRSGRYETPYQSYRILLHGLNKPAKELELDGVKQQDWQAVKLENGALSFEVPEGFHQLTLS